MVKVCITITSHEFEQVIYNSGMALNIIVWYQMCEKCGFDPYFILLKGQEKKILEKDEITFKGRSYKVLDANSEDINNKKDEIFDIDILFPIGTSNRLYYDILKEKNKK